MLVAVGAMGLSQGCAENYTSAFVAGVLFPESGCSFECDLSTSLLPFGTLDLSLLANYRAVLLVGNQLRPRGSADQLRAESARIVLRGAIIELTDPAGEPIAEPFSSPGVGFVHPGSGNTPGSGCLSVEVIPPDYLDLPQRGEPELVIAHIRAYGESLGGSLIVSSVLSFPIYTCNGCLVSYPVPVDECDEPEGAEEFGGCVVGQDFPVDCRLL